MITSVDSNILIDIFGADPKFGRLSSQALKVCLQEGAVFTCELVWTEVATVFPNDNQFMKAMKTLGVEFSSINEETALFAANAWRRYRKMGGKRERIAADFLIGAHAKIQGNRLLTRDRGFYRSYFKTLAILDASAEL